MLILNDLHDLILKICRDKYSVPEMMAERITKEVDEYCQAQVNHLASMIEKEAREGVADILHRPYEGELCRINGEYKVRLALSERVELADQICALIVAQKEEARQAVAEEIRKGLEKKFECMETNPLWTYDWPTFWDKFEEVKK